jgi:hypothetical protein
MSSEEAESAPSCACEQETAAAQADDAQDVLPCAAPVESDACQQPYQHRTDSREYLQQTSLPVIQEALVQLIKQMEVERLKVRPPGQPLGGWLAHHTAAVGTWGWRPPRPPPPRGV